MSVSPIPMGAAGHAVAAKIRLLRRQRGLRLTDLSLRTGELGRPMLSTVLSKVERGVRRLDVDDLVVIAGALDVDPAVLLETTSGCSACSGEPPAGFACLSCGARR